MQGVPWSVNREVKNLEEALFYAFLWFSNFIFASVSLRISDPTNNCVQFLTILSAKGDIFNFLFCNFPSIKFCYIYF